MDALKNIQVCVANYCKSCIVDPKVKLPWREQVGGCTMSTCPLYTVRPMPEIKHEDQPEAVSGNRTGSKPATKRAAKAKPRRVSGRGGHKKKTQPKKG